MTSVLAERNASGLLSVPGMPPWDGRWAGEAIRHSRFSKLGPASLGSFLPRALSVAPVGGARGIVEAWHATGERMQLLRATELRVGATRELQGCAALAPTSSSVSSCGACAVDEFPIHQISCLRSECSAGKSAAIAVTVKGTAALVRKCEMRCNASGARKSHLVLEATLGRDVESVAVHRLSPHAVFAVTRRGVRGNAIHRWNATMRPSGWGYIALWRGSRFQCGDAFHKLAPLSRLINGLGTAEVAPGSGMTGATGAEWLLQKWTIEAALHPMQVWVARRGTEGLGIGTVWRIDARMPLGRGSGSGPDATSAGATRARSHGHRPFFSLALSRRLAGPGASPPSRFPSSARSNDVVIDALCQPKPQSHAPYLLVASRGRVLVFDERRPNQPANWWWQPFSCASEDTHGLAHRNVLESGNVEINVGHTMKVPRSILDFSVAVAYGPYVRLLSLHKTPMQAEALAMIQTADALGPVISSDGPHCSRERRCRYWCCDASTQKSDSGTCLSPSGFSALEKLPLQLLASSVPIDNVQCTRRTPHTPSDIAARPAAGMSGGWDHSYNKGGGLLAGLPRADPSVALAGAAIAVVHHGFQSDRRGDPNFENMEGGSGSLEGFDGEYHTHVAVVQVTVTGDVLVSTWPCNVACSSCPIDRSSMVLPSYMAAKLWRYRGPLDLQPFKRLRVSINESSGNHATATLSQARDVDNSAHFQRGYFKARLHSWLRARPHTTQELMQRLLRDASNHSAVMPSDLADVGSWILQEAKDPTPALVKLGGAANHAPAPETASVVFSI